MKQKIKEIAKEIKRSNNIALFHHVNPDGDTLSSSYGLLRALKTKFPNKNIKWVADIKSIGRDFGYIVENFDDAISGEEINKDWTVIIGDNAVEERIFGSEYYKNGGTKICFDHHQNEINFEHDLYWQQSDLGASSVQAYLIAKELKVNFDSKTAISLIFGILTDTFNFTYSLNDTRPVDAASDLMKSIDKDDMDEMYKNLRKRTLKDIQFQAFALSNFETKNGVAFLKIKDTDLKKLKLEVNDASRVNLIGNIEGYDVWMFLIEDKKEKQIRVSLRSLSLPVNEVASKFGGGGHIRASGIKIPIDWKKADEIINTTVKKLKLHNQK